jgi:hypothetical protein
VIWLQSAVHPLSMKNDFETYYSHFYFESDL